MTLLELQTRVPSGLERRLAELIALLQGSADPDLPMRRFHSLAGIAGTDGFHGVTEWSRQAEELCVRVIESGLHLNNDQRRKLMAMIESIRDSAASKG